MKEEKILKVLFYFGGFAPVGGIETFCYNLLSYLHLEQQKCNLLCWGKPSELLQSLKAKGIQIIHHRWRWGCRWDVPDWLLLFKEKKVVQEADIIILGKLFPYKILRQIRASTKELTPMIFITPYQPIVPHTSLSRAHLLEQLELFDLILVQSSSFIEDLRTIGYRGEIEVIPYISRQPDQVQLFPDTTQFKVGFLGRLVEDKNIPLLLEAFAQFQVKYANAFNPAQHRKPTLHLFGDGDLRKRLEELANAYGIEASVIFHGTVSNATVTERIASCHLFAFTSTYEGQCLAALEILGAGRPLVVTPAGALPEIVSDERLGRLVEIPTPETFSNALMSTAREVVNGAIVPNKIQRAYLERYDPTTVAKQYINVLTDIHSRKRSRQEI